MNDFEKEIKQAFRKGMRDGFLAVLPLIIALGLLAYWIFSMMTQ